MDEIEKCLEQFKTFLRETKDFESTIGVATLYANLHLMLDANLKDNGYSTVYDFNSSYIKSYNIEPLRAAYYRLADIFGHTTNPAEIARIIKELDKVGQMSLDRRDEIRGSAGTLNHTMVTYMLDQIAAGNVDDSLYKAFTGEDLPQTNPHPGHADSKI